MTFTGSQFRDKYEIEPRTWYRNLHSVTEYIYFTRLILSKLIQIIFYKNGVEMIRSVIKYILLVCLFGLGFGQVDYSEIQGIFDNCTNCHGSAGGLNLTSYENLMDGGSSGPVITPYDHTTSELYNRIALPESSDENMPPQGSLIQSEIDLIAQWIEEGALSSPAGCTDPEAYNCDDDDGVNYTFTIGDIQYVNGCNYILNDYLELEYIGGCDEGAPCEGFYNPSMTNENGSCDYYQSPSDDDVGFTVEDTGILIDWSSFVPPINASILGYHVQRCTENCVFISGSAFPWNDTNIGISETYIFDEFEWEADVEIKYAINVKYSNAEAFGMAIGASYVSPGSCPCALGDTNCDGGWNVLDIVGLANCVLASNCDGSMDGDDDSSCAYDLNGDGGWNVLDIVALANCVLTGTCGG